MNYVNGYVTQVISGVYQSFGKFWVKVVYNSYGRFGETSLMFTDYGEALAVGIGYEFNT